MRANSSEAIFLELETFSSMYTEWITRTIRGEMYRILIDILHNTRFEWVLDRDEHRASDGKNLRVRFADESGIECKDEWLTWDCSVLEMLVALAYSIEDNIMYDYEKGDRTHLWFWTMMHNLGLDICTDEWMIKHGKDCAMYVSDRWNVAADRAFDTSGKGGLFPLKHAIEDQRRVELWSQANAYFIENPS